jgi:hypothetical protein
VHELRADGAAIVAARFRRVRAVGRRRRERLGWKKLTERIECGLEITPATKDVEGGFARGAVGGGLSFGFGLSRGLGCHDLTMLDPSNIAWLRTFDIRRLVRSVRDQATPAIQALRLSGLLSVSSPFRRAGRHKTLCRVQGDYVEAANPHVAR